MLCASSFALRPLLYRLVTKRKPQKTTKGQSTKYEVQSTKYEVQGTKHQAQHLFLNHLIRNHVAISSDDRFMIRCDVLTIDRDLVAHRHRDWQVIQKSFSIDC